MYARANFGTTSSWSILKVHVNELIDRPSDVVPTGKLCQISRFIDRKEIKLLKCVLPPPPPLFSMKHPIILPPIDIGFFLVWIFS